MKRFNVIAAWLNCVFFSKAGCPATGVECAPGPRRPFAICPPGAPAHRPADLWCAGRAEADGDSSGSRRERAGSPALESFARERIHCGESARAPAPLARRAMWDSLEPTGEEALRLPEGCCPAMP